MKAMYVMNEKLNGIEITFEGKPSEAIRKMMKDEGYRWHRVKQLWYAKYTEERENVAKKVCKDVKAEEVPAAVAEKKETKKATVVEKKAKKTAKKATKPVHHFKVGDILASSWGYEQTNINLYQVVALNGKTMITVKEVNLEPKEVTAQGPMSEDISFKLPKGIVAPEDGKEIRRKVVNYGKEPAGEHISITDYAFAHKYNGEKLYRSWYA